MFEVIEKAFARELLAVSSKASRLIDFTWSVYNIGGTVPVNTVTDQFEEAKEFVSILSKAGMMRYSLGGFINKEQKKESVSVYVSEDVLKLVARGGSRKEFEEALFKDFGERLIPYCRSDLTECLAVMLTSTIFYATPQKPVFMGAVVRKAEKVCMKNYMECKDILDYYLHRFLGLVNVETGSMLNLSVRSQQRIRHYPKVWDMYMREYKSKEGAKAEEPRVEKKPPAKPELTEQEKKLRGYFPWLKL
jgi:hypothetical protein